MNLAAREPGPEWMDDPAADPAELREALSELEAVNRWLGGYRASLDALAALWPAGRKELTLLDVGAGGGDTARKMSEWAREKGLRLHITGIDLSEISTLYAKERSRDYPDIRFTRQNLWDMPETERFDVVHAALVLHHFPGREATRALRGMHRLSRLGVIVNDLHRHALAYYSIRFLTARLSRNRLVRHDGPLSVLRAFRPADLERMASEAGLPSPEIRWRWPFRWQIVIRK